MDGSCKRPRVCISIAVMGFTHATIFSYHWAGCFSWVSGHVSTLSFNQRPSRLAVGFTKDIERTSLRICRIPSSVCQSSRKSFPLDLEPVGFVFPKLNTQRFESPDSSLHQIRKSICSAIIYRYVPCKTHLLVIRPSQFPVSKFPAPHGIIRLLISEFRG